MPDSTPSAISKQTGKPGMRALKVFYALGPGDIVGMLRTLLAGQEFTFEMSIPFSTLFIDWCRASGARAHLLSWNAREDSLSTGEFIVENLPKPQSYYKGGIQHHMGEALYGWMLIARAVRERPDVVIVDSGTTHWIVLAALSLFRLPVIAVMHCTLWPSGFPPVKKLDRLLRAMDGLFFRHFAAATVCVSPEAERQIRSIAGSLKGPLFQCRAQYKRGLLDCVSPVPEHDSIPFRVLFLGRVEVVKGVFLIVSIAERLEKEMPCRFSWKILGNGSSLDGVREQVAERSLGGIVDVPGRLPREQSLAAFGWAHALVVPTTSGFAEGLAMTAAEATLAGRPVVMSEVVPAWEVLGNAAIRVETDNLDAFVEAFKKLAMDQAYYQQHQKATHDVAKQFYDADQGLGAVLGKAIGSILKVSGSKPEAEVTAETGSSR